MTEERMRPENSLPSYRKLFAELDGQSAAGDGSRSVYSPPAYLADLLQLLADDASTAGLTERRPDLTTIPLDAAHSYTELPYLDIVNEILANQIADGGSAFEVLRTLQHPFQVPYSLPHERVRRYLNHLGVDPVELYRQFAPTADPDVVAREYLGLTPEDVALVTTVLGDGPQLRACYRLDPAAADPYQALEEVDRFLLATSMTTGELRALLYGDLSAAGAPAERSEAGALFAHHDGQPVTLDADETHLVGGDDAGHVPVEWFDRVNRFVRFARRTGLSFTDLDLVLRTCCDNRIDTAALQTIAVVIRLGRDCDLPVDVVVSLVAPINTLGIGDEDTPRDLFNRIFNVPFVAVDRTLLRVPAYLPPGYAGLPELVWIGDLLTPGNAGYRRRVAAALGIADGVLVAIVDRYRARAADGTPGPFDRGGPGLAALSLLHRITRLATALGTSVDELLDVLDALERDPTIQRYFALPVLTGTSVQGSDYYAILAGADVDSGLWLVQMLVAVVRWLQASDLTGRELIDIIGGGSDTAQTQAGGDADWYPLQQRLQAQVEAVGLAPDLFVSARFGPRAAQVIHDVISGFGDGVTSRRYERLLRVDPDRAAAAAYAATAELSTAVSTDFRGLGLDERFTGKLFNNLVLAGYLDAGGEIAADRLPRSAEDLRLSGDFSAHRQSLFDLIASHCTEAAPGEPVSFYPSDLIGLTDEITDADRTELYDNLVFNGYLDPDGTIRQPDFLTVPDNAATFAVNADVGAVAAQVHALLLRQVARFTTEPITLDPAILAVLGLPDRQLADLVDSLRFNGYLDRDDRYLDPAGIVALAPGQVNLALQFYPYRRAVLDAMQDQLLRARAELSVLTPDDLRDITDAVVSQRVVDRLDGGYLREGRLTDEAVGFLEDPRDRLVGSLVAAGDLAEDLTVAEDRLAYFGYVHHALDITLPGLEDFSRDVFFLLHRPATETTAAVGEISAAVTARAAEQRAAILAVLQDAFGAPATTVEAICAAVVGSLPDAVELLTVPTPEGSLATADPDVRRAVRRIRGFARLAAKLNLSGTEVEAAFYDQDLTGKFPEPLALPPDVDRIDALLERPDGTVHLFRELSWWTYAATTHALVDPAPKPLADLSPRFADLAGVDAAFTDVAGTEWVVGRDADGVSHTFVREPGRSHFLPRQQAWGTLRNTFDGVTRIDAAFVDEQGRAYLFCADQYVRYSGPDYGHVDEGYPRMIGDWWEGDGHQGRIPPRFRAALDAAFRGLDGRTYLFSGDHFLTVGGDADQPGPVERPVADAWGRVANALAGADRADAAYVAGPALFVFAGNQVVSYSDSIENDGVCVDSGYPKRIESHFGDVPAEFEGRLEAAFVDPTGIVHLFKDCRTVALRPEGPSVVPTAERWGLLGPVLPSGTVDAAMVGLDGRTYLFSGDQYLRYPGSDYSVVDVGYPRAIAGDWGGLGRVDTAFVVDGATYLFGTGALLFDLPLPAGPAADLAAGRLPRSVRQQLADHGVSVAADVTVGSTDTGWELTADRDLRITLRRSADRVEVRCDDAPCYVRYSTRSYLTPDPGHPRPVTDNWWNLPDALVSGEGAGFARVDEVLTGRDGRMYLFSGDQFVVSDNKLRWWSEPRLLKENWDSLPFDRVDAAFIGTDAKTYLFSGSRYVRYSNGTHTRIDDRYPAPIRPFWGNVVNNIARTGRVDAALVVDDYMYLFSGNQFVRYTGTGYGTVDDGYPRRLADLPREPRFAALTTPPAGIDAAFADKGTIYLFSGKQIHAVSAATYRRYDALATDAVGCAFLDGGAVQVEHPDGWHRYSALEGAAVTAPAVRPRALRGVPPEFQTGLDAVLPAADGNVYLFQGPQCYDTRLGRVCPVAEAWGRPRNTVYHDNAVDAAFVGADGKTYVFSDDQFVVYSGIDYLDAAIDGAPRPVAEHWAGLTRVALAYVRDGTTYVFEPPDESGSMRYLVYSGKDYDRPDDGYPRWTDAGFWDLPDRYRPAGFTLPEAVMFTADTMLLLTGGTFLEHNETTGTWSYPRPLERIWRGIGPLDGLTTAFTGRDGATYVFFAHEFTRLSGQTFSARQPIRDHWGRSPNNFLAAGGEVIDAAFVHRGAVTYLFSGDQYVRYSSADCWYVDPGYPKPIVGNLRAEEPFTNLPASFDEELAERAAGGRRSMVDAVVANGRNVFLFVDRTCHVVSLTATATYDLGVLGRVRNTVADRKRVDAALVAGEHTLLFSGDQYVRYTGGDYGLVDDGYPRTIADALPAELSVPALSEEFHDGIDAAFRAADGRTYLFAGGRYLALDGVAATSAPIAGTWGLVHNEFRAAGGALDAAFVTATGQLYAFAGGQYVRYAAGALDTVEPGFPRGITDDWGDLPAAFEDGIDGAFRLHGRTYLTKGEEYVRYSGDRFDAVDRTYPQLFRYRWADVADYRIDDVRAIARFTALARAHPELDGFLLPGIGTVADPYRYLADAFGWDVDELKWCHRHSRLLSRGPDDEDRLDLEFILELVDLFALTDRLGAGPSRVFREVWSRLYASGDLDAAADVLAELLARRTGPADWRHGRPRHHLPGTGGDRRDPALHPPVPAESGTDRRRRGGPAADQDLVDLDAQLPHLGGQPPGVPLPGELPAAGAARRQDARVRRAGKRPAPGRDHGDDRGAGVQALPGRVHRGLPADHRRRLRLQQGPRPRRPAPAGPVRPDQDRPAPVLLPAGRVRQPGEAVRDLGAVAAGQRPDRRGPRPPGPRVRAGVRLLGGHRGGLRRRLDDHHGRGQDRGRRAPRVRPRQNPTRQDLLLVLQPDQGMGTRPDTRYRRQGGRHDLRHHHARPAPDEARR
ncbi:MAG: hypothetical protein AUI14_23830 [Actinobacteria bacterium 13_2_20CM_2_71_6]|nr:MAG: hypothetical protein AUI14_23830 [Actinobacteria bacterium 13_2_20CM_2_71_6]